MTESDRDAADVRPLLARIVETPHLAEAVPRLPPEMLHHLVEGCGLEDSGALVALATPAQLSAMLDLDLWRSETPGLDEQFDAARFGVWLEVLVDQGAEIAASKVAGLDAAVVVAALAQHVRVFDPGTFEPTASSDDEALAVGIYRDGVYCEVGGYLVVSRESQSWDAIVTVLVALDEQHAAAFHRIMHGCRRLSNSAPEIDGLDDLLMDPGQHQFDVDTARERRRDARGYLTPAQARAFLQSARRVPLDRATAPVLDPIAAASLRTLEETAVFEPADGEPVPSGSRDEPVPGERVDAADEIVQILMDAGALPGAPRALLNPAPEQSGRCSRLQDVLRLAGERGDALAVHSRHLGFLANALVAGCSIQGRRFTPREASDAVAAICNLGLERWPSEWPPSSDLITVFEVGWTVLYEQVCLVSADALLDVLADVRCSDLVIQRGLNDLRFELAKHRGSGTPWRARDAFDVLASLDMPAWAALLGLIDECPVALANVTAGRSRIRSFRVSDFQFISEADQLAAVRGFLPTLPDLLTR